MVRLVPMTEADFEAYLDYSLPSYAQEHVRAGNWPAGEAAERAQRQYAELLPDGVETEGHFLYTLWDGDLEVGALWFMIRDWGAWRKVFVCDVQIHEPYRRQGYASAAFHLLEEWAQKKGLDGIALHVFAHNGPARALYQKLGFAETDLWMSKKL